MQFTYTLSPEAISREYSITGIRPAPTQNFTVDDLDSTPEIRALYELMRHSDDASFGDVDQRFAGWDHSKLRQYNDYAFLGGADRYLTEEDVLPYLQKSKERQDAAAAVFQVKVDAAATEVEQQIEMIESGTLDEEFTIKAWNNCVQAMGRFAIPASDRFRSVQVLVKALIEAKTIREKAEYEAEGAVAASREILRQETKAAALAARIKKKEEAEEAKILWIKDYGDDRLKRAIALGHPCEEGYVTQRASREYPEFTLEYYGQSPWNNDIYPSVKAMDMLENLPEGFEIVWLTILDEKEGYRETEALMLRAYMGTRAALYREVSQP